MANSYLVLHVSVCLAICCYVVAACPKDVACGDGNFDPEMEDNLNLLQLGLSMHARGRSGDCPEATPEQCQDGTCVAEKSLCSTHGELPLRPSESLSTLEDSAQSSTGVVAITYCDEGFASIWPTFIKCYEQALGCSKDSSVEKCGPSKPMLLDLALESPQPGKTALHCTKRRQPTGVSGALGQSLLQTSASLTPHHVPSLIIKAMTEQLTLGKDVLRIDADAFLLTDPMKILQEEYPDADIVSSVDCADVAESAKCRWYLDKTWKKWHTDKDPLAELGFQLNTGLTYVRSNPRTIALTLAAADSVRSGRSAYEQIAFNEELIARNCRYQTADALPAPGGVKTWLLMRNGKEPLKGNCDDGLKVVILPMTTFNRFVANMSESAAIHPGSTNAFKMTVLPNISDLCDERANRRPHRVPIS